MEIQSSNQVLDSEREKLDGWVVELLGGYKQGTVRERKVIRDGVHGFQHLLPHEVAIVDTPLIQRLRFIHQTALAYLIYPTMTHTRFDHSLGMAFVADSMIRSLQSKYRGDIDERQVQIVRLAALLHDTGHTIFSHLGEGVIDTRFGGLFDQIKRAEVGGRARFFEGANSGEILSYLIATCPTMKSFLQEQFDRYRSKGCMLQGEDVDFAAGLIVGQVDDEHRYLSDIINGPIDADKLDYIRRDCYFSGIRAEIDVPRIIFGLDLIDRSEWPKYLTTDSSVIPQLEQILLAKLMLYTSIYHHHKVRALECAMKSVFDSLSQGTPNQSILQFKSVTDFLRLQEFQFLTWGLEEPLIKEEIKDLLQRTLLKRALVINPHTVDVQSRHKLTTLRSSNPDEESLTETRLAIFQSIPLIHQTELRELWLDLPKAPDTNEEAHLCWVKFSDTEVQTLSDTLPTDDWVETYEAHKLNYFVFYNPDEDRRRSAAEKASAYLQEQYGIGVTEVAKSRARI